MIQIRKCKQIIENKYPILSIVDESNLDELKKLESLFIDKINIGDFICSDVDTDMVMFDKDLKPKKTYYKYSKTSFFELDETKKNIIEKESNPELEGFIIIQTRQEKEIAKFTYGKNNSKRIKIGSILIKNKHYSFVFDGDFEEFQNQYTIIDE